MYGDTAAMRRRAAQLRDQGTDVRAMADRLVAQLDVITWQGRAAADLRSRIHDRAAHLRECASQHDSAADSLERHVHEIDRSKESILQIERRAGSVVADARTRIARLRDHHDGAGIVREPTDSDRVLDEFEPPPSGHKSWLDVELPGL